MKIEEIMAKDIACADVDEKVGSVALKMKQRDVGALPVCENGKIVGIVTDRDLVVRGLANGRDLSQAPVREMMSRHPVWGTGDGDIEDAVRLMEKKQIRRLPVVDQARHIIGMLSLGDIATHAPHELSGEALEAISLTGKPLEKRARANQMA